jgi:hypothetical protein
MQAASASLIRVQDKLSRDSRPMGQIVPELGGEMGPYCVVYDTRLNFETGKTPILFSKKIGKMKDVLAARSVDVGAIKHDRQGIRYFQIHDPERNVIEVVKER